MQDAKLFSESKIARIEAGKVPVRVGDVWTLCRFYQAGNEVTDALAALCESATRDGWCADYSTAVAEWSELYLGLEESCSNLSTYCPALVPGLLQTEDYARSVLVAAEPLAENLFHRQLGSQTSRPRRIQENSGRQVNVVLGAGALELVIGSPAVMAEQVSHLVELNTMDSVDIRILPWDAGPHAGLNGTFTIMDFDDSNDPSVVYLESLIGFRYTDLEHDVSTYRASFNTLAQQAVSIAQYATADSGRWISSGGEGSAAECVEIRRIDRFIEVRDRTDPGGPRLVYTPREFAAWLGDVEKGHLGDAVRETLGSACRSEQTAR